jgi:hypothetical protein
MLLKLQKIKRVRLALISVLALGVIFGLYCNNSVGAQSIDGAAQNAPRCYISSIAGNARGSCSDYSRIPAGTTFEQNKCYNVRDLGGTNVTVEVASCDSPRFSDNAVSARCADNQISSGTGTAEDVCAASGGVAGAIEEDQDRISNPDREEALNCANPQECFEKNPIVSVLNIAITFMIGLVGVVVVVVIIWAGIEYSSSGGDPNRTASAKKRIINAIIALVSFIFLWAFLQWLVPGSPF